MTQTGNMRIYGITLLVLLFISAMPISAEEFEVQTTGAVVSQFYAYSPSYTSACTNTPATDSITVKNQGTVPDTYAVTINADIPITVSEQLFSLNPGQEKEVFLYITAPDAKTYSFTVQIASAYDSTKDIQKSITAHECSTFFAQGYPQNQQSCPCSTVVYVFQVTNTGTAADTYSLSLKNMDSTYYDLSEYSIVLQPKQTKEVYAYIRMACFEYGQFDFTLIAENDAYSAELPLYLTIPQACYNYNIALGEALVFSHESLDMDYTPAQDTSYELCQETPAVIPVQIQNPGEVMNEYNLFIEDAEDWITAAEPYIKLNSNKERVTSIVVNPAAADTDTYSFALKAKTLRGDLESVIPFTVTVTQCTEQGLPAWLKYTLYTLLGIVILAILFAGYQLTKKPESKTGQYVQKNKKWLWIPLLLLLLFILLGLFAYPQVKELYGTSAIPLGETWKTVETVFYNWATALIVLGTLLLLALLLWYLKFRKKKNNGKCKDRYKAYYEKIKPALKWLWILLLLAILLAALGAGGYYLYKNYKEDASKVFEIPEEIQINTTEQSDQELTEVQQNITNTEEQIAALQEELLKLAEQAATEENSAVVEQYEARIQELLEKIAALEEQLAALQQHETDFEQRIAELEEQITALQTMIAQLSLEKANETIINETQEKIEELTEQKNTITVILTPVKIPLEEIPVITDDSYETTLVFDISLSGQIVEDGMTRFQRGVEAAEKYVQEKGMYNIMIIGKNPIMIKRDATRRDTLRTIHLLRPLDTQSNLGTALYKAAEDFHEKKGRIVLISDMRTTDNTDISAIHDDLEEQGFDIVFIDISYKIPILTEETIPPYFNVEAQTSETFFLDIPMNTEHIVDLNNYFADEDNDILTYTATAGEHLAATIKDNLATLIPEQDWTGTTTVVFAADDTKGGYVESPALVVNVFEPTEETASEEIYEPIEEVEETTETAPAEIAEEYTESSTLNASLEQYIPWIIIGSILTLIIVSLVVGAFMKKYQH
jgi:hypothetical protein